VRLNLSITRYSYHEFSMSRTTFDPWADPFLVPLKDFKLTNRAKALFDLVIIGRPSF